MKKCLLMVVVLCISIFAAACSNDSEKSKTISNQADLNTLESTEGEINDSVSSRNENAVVQEASELQEEDSSAAEVEAEYTESDRKIIYTANLFIEVKDYQQTINTIQSQVANRGGYIVDSNMTGDTENNTTNGHVTVRIPQEQFREFIQIMEEGSSKVLESSISGQDVTEEFIDLDSRLKSKRVVEERLLAFMEQAEKTEDLLTISADLADVQGEIDEITGRIKYLENKTDLATVTISIQENNVTISGMNDGDLNTWEKTKQQFLKSINFLIAAFSGIFVFIIGNFPVFIVLGVIALIIFIVYRRTKKK
ncbi:DUF4349 domain-containing protein [Oceanobacillus rekensis]|uniref:DUF4349 domain-containing protein n=1 Tax=Oceanobacillus rekensis TaxID=937927 RepID=UPI000B44010C|nr:DUF4349 domain-containing protein [Oceanobacillus rekensis]